MDFDWLLADDNVQKAETFADQLLTWLATSGVRILVILLLAAGLRIAAGWLIRRFFRTMVDSGSVLSSMTSAVVKRDTQQAEAARARREQRAKTLSTVAVNIAAAAIGIMAGIMIIAEFGVNVGPIIASLGVVGVAAGIGAQTIIKDFIAGLVMLFEDVIAVGDVIDIEYATGTVVDINLRTTQVRSLDGVLWTVRNGEIIRVGNMSRGFSNAVVQLDISNRARDADVTAALEKAVAAIWSDETFRELLLEEPVVSGILSVDGARVQRRIVAKVMPGQQWTVEQELRHRVRTEFEEAGIEFAMPPFMQHTTA
ncbi:mechanosensitive ion channel family protein [Brachybacterium nesterenkovii]|uniref:mechanosensitive ion channel family protein n=1 Tax=Brachybacterium nesterenkovii TaxID=47847 RepID=UPI00321B2680